MASQGSANAQGRQSSTAVKENANKAFIWLTGVMWQVYRPLLSGPAEAIIPEHTRNAFFQLWCDLRTNVPKDKKWFQQHAAALQPHTLPGWIALSSFLLFGSAGACATLCLAVVVLALATYALLGVVAVAGLIGAFWLLVFSGMLAVSSLVAIWVGGCMAFGYVALASTIAVLTYGHSLVFKRTPKYSRKRRHEVEDVQMSSTPDTGASPAGTGQTGPEQQPAQDLSFKDLVAGKVVPKSGLPNGEQKTTPSNSSSSSESTYASTRAPDVSPGRAPQTGTASLQKTPQGQPTAEVLAQGGPTVTGQNAAALHPRKIGNGSTPAVQAGA